MDASIRFQPCFPDLLQTLEHKLQHSGVVMLHRAVLTVYSTTTPTLYNYLNTNITQLMPLMSYGGGLVLFQRKPEMLEHIMKWLVLCSLEHDCIMPPGSKRSCGEITKHKPAGFITPYKNCHRYDMSILGILQANLFDYDIERYTIRRDQCVKVERFWQRNVKLAICVAADNRDRQNRRWKAIIKK